MKDEFKNNNVVVIDVDWTEYQPQVLKFMQKFGRSGLPFYVLFSKRYPDGTVTDRADQDVQIQIRILIPQLQTDCIGVIFVYIKNN